MEVVFGQGDGKQKDGHNNGCPNLAASDLYTIKTCKIIQLIALLFQSIYQTNLN